MFFSKAVGYAIKAMLDIAGSDNGAGTITREVAERQKIPASFLAKLVQRLAHAGLLRIHRGAGGGIKLARPPSEISLRQVIEAIDGPISVAECLLRPGNCPQEKVCPIHLVWRDLQEKTSELLEQTLADLLVSEKELVANGISTK